MKICLILNYLGQGAWLICNQSSAELQSVEMLNPFFQMLPEALRPLAVVLGAAAAVIASQALITGSFTLVSEAIRLDLLPHLEVKYPADTKGQLYIPAVNRVLMVGCIIIVLLFRSGSRMETAYGLAITVSMLTVTLLLAVYLWRICSKKLFSGSGHRRVLIFLAVGSVHRPHKAAHGLPRQRGAGHHAVIKIVASGHAISAANGVFSVHLKLSLFLRHRLIFSNRCPFKNRTAHRPVFYSL